MSPGGKYLLYFDEKTGALVHLPHRGRRRASTSPSELPVKFYDEDHDTPDLPPASASAGWTDGRQVGAALRRVRHLGGPAGRHRRAHGHQRRGPQAAARRSATASLDPDAARPIPTDKPLLLSTTNDDTRATGFYRVAVHRHRRAREDRDAGQGVRRADQGEERRRRRLHAVDVRRVPGPLGERHELHGHEEGHERQPAAGRVRLGQGRADRVHQRRRQGAARDPRSSRTTSIRRRSTR